MYQVILIWEVLPLQTMLLDEAAGVKVNEQPVLPLSLQQGTAEVASWNKRRVKLLSNLFQQCLMTNLSSPVSQESVREQVGSYKFIHARNIQRPQLKFRDQVDNSNNPFIPLIRCKPNAKKPLPESKSPCDRFWYLIDITVMSCNGEVM